MSNSSRYQQTLRDVVEFSGIGLHSGKRVKVKIRPAPQGSGIVFIRSDIKKSTYIKACPENVVSAKLATTIGVDGVNVSTIEHLMSAFYAYGIDNAIVEVDNGEVPILDGSSLGYTYLFSKIKLVSQKRLRKVIRITKPFTLQDGDKKITISPSNEYSVSCKIQFNHPLIKTQKKSISINKECFENEIAPARTFGFAKDVEKMRSMGLAKGGSLKNAVVLDSYSVVNKGGLRFKNEFVRHKILDLIGDFATLGMPILGKVEAERAGHDFHISFIKALLESSCYEIVTLKPERKKSRRLSIKPIPVEEPALITS